MRLLRIRDDWSKAPQGTVLAIGNFDGVHCGHQAVLATARSLAEASGAELAVMTFEPHPRRYFKPDLPPLRILPFAQKARQLSAQGVEALLVVQFNAALATLSAEAFCQDILHTRLRVLHVVTGENFIFGNGRGGDSAFLQAQAKALEFGYTPVAKLGDYSSSAIREALSRGAMEEAAAILGRPYAITGRVQHGEKRGRELGFPTANIRPAGLFLPRFGVYAVKAEIEGVTYPAVANIGKRPTVRGEMPLLEVHIMGATLDCYGKKMRVDFQHFLREEQCFASLDALKAQIAKDAQQARIV